MESFTIFAGVDRGSQTHQLCALDGTRNVLLEKAVAHSGAGLAELAASLLALTRGDPSRIAVAIEVPRGPVVETLLEQGIAVFAINPKQLDRFRDRHTVSGAKDDRRDALVLADSLRTDAPAFRRLQMASPLLLQLRDASRMHDELKAERVALGNRLREQLQRYFPRFCSWIPSTTQSGCGTCSRSLQSPCSPAGSPRQDSGFAAPPSRPPSHGAAGPRAALH